MVSAADTSRSILPFPLGMGEKAPFVEACEGGEMNGEDGTAVGGMARPFLGSRLDEVRTISWYDFIPPAHASTPDPWRYEAGEARTGRS
jgi:hypothetical protein